MAQYAKIKFLKRQSYLEAVIYYSRHGVKLRESTLVQVRYEHMLPSEKISSQYPSYVNDVSIIQQALVLVDNLIVGFVQEYRQRPSVAWLKAAVDHSRLSEIVSQKHLEKPSSLQKNWRFPRWLTKITNQHDHSFALFPHRPQTAASGK